MRKKLLSNEPGASNAYKQVLDFVHDEQPTGTGLIFCSTCNDAEKLAEFLTNEVRSAPWSYARRSACLQGVSADYFHSKMGAKQRNIAFRMWVNDQTRLVRDLRTVGQASYA